MRNKLPNPLATSKITCISNNLGAICTAAFAQCRLREAQLWHAAGFAEPLALADQDGGNCPDNQNGCQLHGLRSRGDSHSESVTENAYGFARATLVLKH